MKKGIIYARVSSREQAEEGYSIPAQLKLLRDYARKNRITIADEFVDVETAKQAGRISFNKALNYLQRSNDVRIVLVEKTDRLYRNFRDYVTIDDLDLEIHLVKENEVISNSSKSHQKFIHGIKVLMAKNYIDNLSEEVTKGMAEKAANGVYPSRAPYGYRNNPVTRGIDLVPEEATVVRRIFEMYATGQYSMKDLRDQVMTERLLPLPPSGYLSKSRIANILNNASSMSDVSTGRASSSKERTKRSFLWSFSIQCKRSSATAGIPTSGVDGALRLPASSNAEAVVALLPQRRRKGGMYTTIAPDTAETAPSPI